MMKRILAILLSVMLCISGMGVLPAAGEEADNGTNSLTEENTMGGTASEEDSAKVTISAPSAILMEASTGQVLYEKSADEELPPASVTKIMTLLLIFDAMASGKIKLEDEVSTSEYAASMGGSQVFLEVGETQTVDTLIKCISVASANDAAVAMAEFVGGSEAEFVKKMNERAKNLGMEHTNFVNCNGLDTDGHLTTARDIALMSRELITKYPQIHEYSQIWMENIVHETRKGSREFGLTNTNKLIRQYAYATGLKTGSTDLAKFCISATAEKDGIELIAVIMAAPTPKERFQDAVTLLDYGFSKCSRYTEENVKKLSPVQISGGQKERVKVAQEKPFTYVTVTGAETSKPERKEKYKNQIKAPVKKGEKVGEVQFYQGKDKVGSVAILTTEAVEKATYASTLSKIVRKYAFHCIFT